MKQSKQSSNRAEEIRRKRTTRPRTKTRTVRSTRGSKPSSSAQPPILGRFGGPSEFNRKRRPTNKRVKRRFDISLGATGAEMRLPSLPVVHLGWRLVSGLIVAGLLFCIYTVWTSPLYRVNFAEVVGLERVTVEEIHSVAGVVDKPIFAIEPSKIQQDLEESFPEFSSIYIKVGLPAQVTIVVEERQPVLVWREAERTFWVDQEGVAFPARGEPAPEIVVEALDSPIQTIADSNLVEEIIQSPFLSTEMVSAIVSMSTKSPENTPLVYMKDHGLGWRDGRGWDVFFGRYDEEIEMKLNLYESIIEYLSEKQIHPALISVEYLHAPYYRLEN